MDRALEALWIVLQTVSLIVFLQDSMKVQTYESHLRDVTPCCFGGSSL
jgi:hypothetical protein